MFIFRILAKQNDKEEVRVNSEEVREKSEKVIVKSGEVDIVGVIFK